MRKRSKRGTKPCECLKRGASGKKEKIQASKQEKN